MITKLIIYEEQNIYEELEIYIRKNLELRN